MADYTGVINIPDARRGTIGVITSQNNASSSSNGNILFNGKGVYGDSFSSSYDYQKNAFARIDRDEKSIISTSTLLSKVGFRPGRGSKLFFASGPAVYYLNIFPNGRKTISTSIGDANGTQLSAEYWTTDFRSCFYLFLSGGGGGGAQGAFLGAYGGGGGGGGGMVCIIQDPYRPGGESTGQTGEVTLVYKISLGGGGTGATANNSGGATGSPSVISTLSFNAGTHTVDGGIQGRVGAASTGGIGSRSVRSNLILAGGESMTSDNMFITGGSSKVNGVGGGRVLYSAFAQRQESSQSYTYHNGSGNNGGGASMFFNGGNDSNGNDKHGSFGSGGGGRGANGGGGGNGGAGVLEIWY